MSEPVAICPWCSRPDLMALRDAALAESRQLKSDIAQMRLNAERDEASIDGLASTAKELMAERDAAVRDRTRLIEALRPFAAQVPMIDHYYSIGRVAAMAAPEAAYRAAAALVAEMDAAKGGTT